MPCAPRSWESPCSSASGIRLTPNSLCPGGKYWSVYDWMTIVRGWMAGSAVSKCRRRWDCRRDRCATRSTSERWLREAPPRVQGGHCADTSDRRSVEVEAVVPVAVRGDGSDVPGQEYFVEVRGARRTADGSKSLHHLGMQRRPGIGLTGSHRPAAHESDPLDVEFLGEQSMLGYAIVVSRHMRRSASVERRRGVARGGGDARAEVIRHDNEPATGVKCTTGPVIQAAVSAGVAVNHVGHNTTLSLDGLSSPRVR